MGVNVGSPPLSLSEYNNKDSDGNTFLMDHAYQAQKAGIIYVRDVDLGVSEHIKIYVGPTDDVVGTGDLIQMVESDPNDTDTDKCLSAHVAKGEFFEIRASNAPAYFTWKNFGSLAEPIDFD